jgi:hypothetical protein
MRITGLTEDKQKILNESRIRGRIITNWIRPVVRKPMESAGNARTNIGIDATASRKQCTSPDHRWRPSSTSKAPVAVQPKPVRREWRQDPEWF